ncbi:MULTISPECIES: ABC transporter ATP-binding protein [Corynebacterium]|uniref:ABC transporter ATP-binding protein n=1 Tax=Corynebacterium amycolatum TaxID=43765 RepID=A0AB38XUH5_CORAY|nr:MULTISPECIES: ABC transporter ATP-binding protein [Corynebacterium]AIN82138.1 ABC transporter family protein [Corynebacterium sp. ATCC 6931]KAA9289930.1 ABC transporter ATP-binding protein [Corynebacterium amycolatum]MBC6725281.1 ABC transporter ATP-binding protein [Corynebacterium amycolatum]MBC6757650.1 ABC transporter ATP-binding protein [Corynebacterium sp. LK24]MCG7245259.1 ABC transporter ATP-binding protein [Corynebacterium sp. ACRPX]
MTENNSPRNARLCIRDITKSYNSAPVLTGISLTIEPGETVAVMGPSGSGKSTLLHCMSGVLLPDDGDVIFGDTKINSLSDADRSALRLHDFGFVFQDGQLLPELTARENVALPMILQGRKRSTSLALADDVLSRLGLKDLTRRRPGQMSGGQAQRVAIARAMAGEPGVIFADEPTGALDQSTGHEVMQQLIALVEQTGTTLVMVTHDVRVADWCRRRVEIRDGLIHDDRLLAGAEVTK